MSRGFLLGAASACLAAFVLVMALPSFNDAATFYLYKEDRWLLLAQVVVLALAGWRLAPSVRALEVSPRALLLAGAGAAFLLYLGHVWILCGYDLSRDEQMAVFDSRIFAAGRLVQPLPASWQAHADALNRLYMPAITHPTGWVSAYLPMNAALHALVGMAVSPAFTGPLLTVVGALALWKCARVLWPEDHETALLALLLYFASGQIVLAGMTAYAMPAHLAFNLVWLWLFLLDRRHCDVAALLVGFVATGLHQPLFHPLFFAPFLVLLLHRRAWPRLLLFVLGYAVIGLFWACWPGWMVAFSGGAHASPSPDTDYWSRLKLALLTNDSPRWLDMAANLLRFAAWQHVLLLPLAAMGCVAARRDGFVRALTASVILPVLVMLVILPGQGNGFGYRYLHGEIGCLVLLAMFGWRHLSAERSYLRTLLIRASVGMLLLVLPLQLAMSHALFAAYAQVDKRIATSGADYFIIDQEDAPFAVNLILNRPDLSNRPIRLDARAIDALLRRQICQSGARIGLPRSDVFGPIGAYLGWPLERSAADQDIAVLVPVFRHAGCAVRIIGQSI